MANHSTRRIVFLDVDGVLVTGRHMRARPGFRRCREMTRTGCGYAEFDPECVDNLNILCRSVGASIVVSSTWREFFDSVEDMRAMFIAQGVTAAIIDRTPIDHSIDALRGNEITEWLAANGGTLEASVILDDEDHEWDECCRGRWLHTDFDDGLTTLHAIKAVAMLRGIEINATANG